ncbi:MAG: hypothetical protein QCI38_00570 [Candidatus Thermoplasmatota archaeon]|nr:hypothetical protein [Candidatus Thermoplasmatota archaeon]
MTKEKITISVDERLLQLIDKQRADTKRSTYINSVLEEYFQPRAPEDKGGGTFVTTLELRKTLKAVHDKLSRLELLEATIKDLEGVVYENLYDVKEGLVKAKKGMTIPAMSMAQEEGAGKQVDKWLDGILKKHGNVVIDRDFASYLKIDGVEQSVIGMTRHLRRRGMEYNHEKKQWL